MALNLSKLMKQKGGAAPVTPGPAPGLESLMGGGAVPPDAPGLSSLMGGGAPPPVSKTPPRHKTKRKGGKKY